MIAIRAKRWNNVAVFCHFCHGAREAFPCTKSLCWERLNSCRTDLWTQQRIKHLFMVAADDLFIPDEIESFCSTKDTRLPFTQPNRKWHCFSFISRHWDTVMCRRLLIQLLNGGKCTSLHECTEKRKKKKRHWRITERNRVSGECWLWSVAKPNTNTNTHPPWLLLHTSLQLIYSKIFFFEMNWESVEVNFYQDGVGWYHRAHRKSARLWGQFS